MIDVMRKFLVLNESPPIYFDNVEDFSIQRGMFLKDEREISQLQPGILIINIDNRDLYQFAAISNGPVEKLGVYLMNCAVIFKDPSIYRKVNDPWKLWITSNYVDIIFEHSHKIPTQERLKPLLSLINDERTE